jgi:hypothetical protein
MGMGRSRSRLRGLRVRAALATAALAAALLPAFAAGPAASAAVVPRSPALPVAIDAFASYQGQTTCSPTAKVGATKLAALLRTTYGSASIGIPRSCSTGGQSEHKEGRALDWMLSVRVPAQRAKVQAFLTWLLAPGSDGRPAAMARRLGVMYLGWNNRFWAAYRPDSGWTDLKGCTTDPAKLASGYDTLCHRNHLHISLSWEGALAYTSFWSGTPVAPACEAGWSSGDAVPVGRGTDLVPVTPVRVLSTKSGGGLDAPCRATAAESWSGARRDVVAHVTGVGAVPVDGVAAVAVRVTAYRTVLPLTVVSARTTASSALRPVLTAVTAATTAATTVVPVASDGTIRLAVDRGSADLIVDVVGWVPLAETPAPGPASVVASGRTHLTRPVLVYDGTGRPLAPGESRTVHLGGAGPVPSAGLTGLDLTLTTDRAAGSSSVGVLSPSGGSYVGGLRSSTTTSRATQLVASTSDGTLVLRNLGAYPVVVRLQANAWFTADPDEGGATMTMLPTAVKVVDSAAKLGLSGAVTSSASRVVYLPATAVPAGARGVLLAVSAVGGTSDGTLSVGSSGTVAAVSFAHGQSAHEVVLMPLLTSGAVAFRTASLGTQVRAWVLGYVA